MQAVALLLEHGAQPNARDRWGRRAADEAAVAARDADAARSRIVRRTAAPLAWDVSGSTGDSSTGDGVQADGTRGRSWQPHDKACLLAILNTSPRGRARSSRPHFQVGAGHDSVFANMLLDSGHGHVPLPKRGASSPPAASTPPSAVAHPPVGLAAIATPSEVGHTKSAFELGALRCSVPAGGGPAAARGAGRDPELARLLRDSPNVSLPLQPVASHNAASGVMPPVGAAAVGNTAGKPAAIGAPAASLLDAPPAKLVAAEATAPRSCAPLALVAGVPPPAGHAEASVSTAAHAHKNGATEASPDSTVMLSCASNSLSAALTAPSSPPA